MGSCLESLVSEIKSHVKFKSKKPLGHDFYYLHGAIFRGENQHYESVSSSLYREVYKDSRWCKLNDEERSTYFKNLEAKVLECGRSFLGNHDWYWGSEDGGVYSPSFLFDDPSRDELEDLAKIQHMGGKTNLVDFTMDVNVALFFSCYPCYSDSKKNRDGRVIIFRREPGQTGNIFPNVIHSNSQRSILIRAPDGIIPPNQYDVVSVPAKEKEEILHDLWLYHGIRAETMFTSLQGFITNQYAILERDISRYTGVMSTDGDLVE